MVGHGGPSWHAVILGELGLRGFARHGGKTRTRSTGPLHRPHSYSEDLHVDQLDGTRVPANTCQASRDFATRLKVT